MGFYQSHKGQTGYRLLNLIEQYCGFRVAEDMIMGHNKIEYQGELLATYCWSPDKNDDTPYFQFFGKNKELYARNQFVMMPFVDEPYLQIEWIVQEVRKALSFDEALHLLHITKNYQLMEYSLNTLSFKTKIIQAIIGSFHPNQFERLEQSTKNFLIEEGWKYIAFGAIVQIIPQENLFSLRYDLIKNKQG